MAGIGKDILGYNLYAYCRNNPVNMTDSRGNWPKWIAAAIALTTGTIAVAAALTGNLPLAATAAKACIAAITVYAVQIWHYDIRAEKNTDLPQTPEDAKDLGWLGPDTDPQGPAADCHQNTPKDGPNIKYVSPDGHREVIYNSQNQIVLDARDIGTYNFCPSNELWYSKESFEHFGADILPWIIFGNNDDDPGPILNGIISWFE